MAEPITNATLPSLQKYTRKRRLHGKYGFYLEINGNGEVSCTKDESSPASVLEFLSVGPDLIAIGGAQAKRYLAVDNQGKIFTSSSERKECVFRELLGQNFHSLYRTCHCDIDGRGWYLAIDKRGRLSAKKVHYSDEPQLHFIAKVIKEENEDTEVREDAAAKKRDSAPVWRRRSMEGYDEFIDFNSFTPSPMSGMSRSSLSGGESTGSAENYTSC